MSTTLERLNELEKQVIGFQQRHVELETHVMLLDKVIGLFFARDRPPTAQELEQCSAQTAAEIGAKYGVGVTITPAAPPAPKLIVPHMVIRPD